MVILIVLLTIMVSISLRFIQHGPTCGCCSKANFTVQRSSRRHAIMPTSVRIASISCFLPLDLPRTLASCPRVAADTNRLHWPNAMSYAALDAIVARHGAVRATFKRAQIKRRTLSFAFPILLKLLGRMLYQRSMR